MRPVSRIFLLFTILFATPVLAERSLYWDALEVEARLDEDGRLHVVERHAMVFDGDWNGGERTFNVRKGQSIDIHGVRRLGADGPVDLIYGDTVEVDHYDRSDMQIRWRSRLPSDPPFQNAKLTYEISYTLSGILIGRDGVYRMDHNFAFGNRAGEIRRFALRLDLDPVWRPREPLVRLQTGGPLPPGKDWVVTTTLAYTGSGTPDGVLQGPSPARFLLLVPLIGLPIFIFLRFLSAEHALDRFDRVDPRLVDRQWMNEKIFSVPAEVIGAAWDRAVGPSEVAAVLARLTAEKKLHSKVEGKELSLSLLVPRDRFEGYERELIDKLFFAGDTTSTAAIRTHYRKSGFSPATILATPLKEKADALVPSTGEKPVVRVRGPLLSLIASAAVIIGAMILATGEPDALPVAIFVPSGFILLLGCILAYAFRLRVDYGTGHTSMFLVPGVLPLIMVGVAIYVGALPLILIGVTMWAISMFALFVNIARSRESKNAIAFRKRLAAARSWFTEEMKKPQPDLEDDWLPWILAFGLGTNVDRWFASHGAQTTRATTYTPTSFGGSSGGSRSSGWTGGGGAFGGAGASGSWAAAATGMAAGVAAPSSSSGGGGSSSGGSSGGGGGGGW